MEPNETMFKRYLAWRTASDMVEPIVAQHPLKEHRGFAPPFTTGSMTTEAEQHIDHIVRVADWLLEGQ